MSELERLPRTLPEAIRAIATWLRSQPGRGAAIDLAIGALATRQHGLASRAQLIEIGISPGAVEYRLKSGRLRPVLPGVYRAGPMRARLEREQASVLATGKGSFLSHGTAGMLLNLVDARPGSRIEILTAGPPRRSRGWILVRHTSGLQTDEQLEVEGLPVTTPARTLLDLAGTLPVRELERVLARARHEKLVRPDELQILCVRYAGRPATRVLLAVLGGGAGPVFIRSEAEAAFLELVRRAGLPLPHVNARVEGFEVDFHWRRERLIVEVDGYAFHSSNRAFEQDRLRDGKLIAAGYRVIRVTWRQITEEPEALLVRVAQALKVDG